MGHHRRSHAFLAFATHRSVSDYYMGDTQAEPPHDSSRFVAIWTHNEDALVLALQNRNGDA
jgi:hypothetical protein